MGHQRIEQHATTTADPATVYALLRDGASWPAWTPIESSEIERPGADEPEGIGAVRRFRNGRVTGHDEIVELVPDRRFAYAHTSSLPVRNYRGEIELEPTAEGTAIRWVSMFDPKVPGTGRLLRRGIAKFIAQCTDGLAEHAATVTDRPRSGDTRPQRETSASRRAEA
jgi:uncharacterized protein YndB with AHSA1/START domain